MARISLLFSLALALTLGSLFLSVSSHAPPVRLLPRTVFELQTLPFIRINEILNHKEKFAPKTAEFKAMFTLCKDYVAYLQDLYSFESPIVDVLGIAKAKYALMTKAILAAQASVSVKLDKKASLKLKKRTSDLTKGILQIQKKIVKISAKHGYKAGSLLTVRESTSVGDAFIMFRSSINAFMDIVYDVEEKKMKKVDQHARKLTEAGVNVGAKVGGKVKASIGDFFKSLGIGKEVQFDAAGKMKIAGGDGFRELNKAYYKHFASIKA